MQARAKTGLNSSRYELVDAIALEIRNGIYAGEIGGECSVAIVPPNDYVIDSISWIQDILVHLLCDGGLGPRPASGSIILAVLL